MPKLIIRQNELQTEMILGSQALQIGRLETSDIRIPDPQVSKKHARIYPVEDNNYVIEDLGSTNGTKVNGVKIEKHNLYHGDIISIGSARLTFFDEEVDSLRESTLRISQLYLDAKNTIADSSMKKAGAAVPAEGMTAAVAASPAVQVDLNAFKKRLEEIKKLVQELENALEIAAGVKGQVSREVEMEGAGVDAGESDVTAGPPVDKVTEANRRVFVEIEKIIADVTDFRKASNFILDIAMNILGAKRGFIMLKDPSIKSIVPVVSRALGAAALTSSPSRTIANYVLEKGEAVCVNNPLLDPRFVNPGESIMAGTLKSVIAVPISDEGVNIGVVYLDNPDVEGAFDEKDLSFMMKFAEYAKLTLEKSRIITNMKKEHERIREAALKAAREAEESRKLKRDALEALEEAEREALPEADLPEPVATLVRELRKLGALTEEAIDNAVRDHKATGKSIGNSLMDTGAMSSAEYVKFLVERMKVPSVDPVNVVVPDKLLRLIPEDLARQYTMMPIKFEGGVLRIAMVDPRDFFFVECLKKATCMEIQPLAAEKGAIIQAINKHYHRKKSFIEKVLGMFNF